MLEVLQTLQSSPRFKIFLQECTNTPGLTEGAKLLLECLDFLINFPEVVEASNLLLQLFVWLRKKS